MLMLLDNIKKKLNYHLLINDQYTTIEWLSWWNARGLMSAKNGYTKYGYTKNLVTIDANIFSSILNFINIVTVKFHTNIY